MATKKHEKEKAVHKEHGMKMKEEKHKKDHKKKK
jgi:hypothetical protein